LKILGSELSVRNQRPRIFSKDGAKTLKDVKTTSDPFEEVDFDRLFTCNNKDEVPGAATNLQKSFLGIFNKALDSSRGRRGGKGNPMSKRTSFFSVK